MDTFLNTVNLLLAKGYTLEVNRRAAFNLSARHWAETSPQGEKLILSNDGLVKVFEKKVGGWQEVAFFDLLMGGALARLKLAFHRRKLRK